MHKRLLGSLLLVVLLPIVGSGKLIWHGMALFARLRPKTLLTLVGLVVALSFPNPVSAQLAQAGVWPPGQVITVRAELALGIGVLYHGLRSRGLWRLTRRLLQGRSWPVH